MGTQPVWSPDGTALFYLTLGSAPTFMRATIADRPRLEATRRDSLFAFLYLSYDVMPNGREFLMLKGTRGGEIVTLITNWPQLLTPACAAPPASVP